MKYQKTLYIISNYLLIGSLYSALIIFNINKVFDDFLIMLLLYIKNVFLYPLNHPELLILVIISYLYQYIVLLKKQIHLFIIFFGIFLLIFSIPMVNNYNSENFRDWNKPFYKINDKIINNDITVYFMNETEFYNNYNGESKKVYGFYRNNKIYLNLNLCNTSEELKKHLYTK